MAQESMFGPSAAQVYRNLDSQYMQDMKGASTEDVIGLLGTRAARGVAGALGYEDEGVQKAKLLEKVKAEAQASATPGDVVSYYKAIAKAFHKYGMVEEAARAEQAAEELAGKKEERDLKRLKIQEDNDTKRMNAAGKYTPDQMLKILGDLGKSGKYSGRAIQDFKETGDWSKLGEPSDGEKPIGLVKEEGPNKGRPVFSDGDGPYMIEGGQKIRYNGPLDPLSGVTINNGPKMAEKAMYDASEKAEQAFAERTKGLAQSLPTMVKLATALQEPFFYGAGQVPLTEATRIAAQLGFKVDEKKLRNTDLLQQIAVELVLPKMKLLGGSDSNEELKQLMNAGVNLKFQPQTLIKLVEAYQRDLKTHNEALAKIRAAKTPEARQRAYLDWAEQQIPETELAEKTAKAQQYIEMAAARARGETPAAPTSSAPSGGVNFRAAAERAVSEGKYSDVDTAERALRDYARMKGGK